MNYLIQLTGKEIDGSPVSCLASQLITVLENIRQFVGELSWFAADVDSGAKMAFERHGPLTLIGSTQRLISVLREVDQLWGGVFVGVKGSALPARIREVIDTFDDFNVDLGDSVCEIRACDTTSLDILVKQEYLALSIAESFGGENKGINIVVCR